MLEPQKQNNLKGADQPHYSEEIALQNLGAQSELSDQYYAAWWLGKMRSRHPETIPLLLNKLRIFNQQHISLEERGIALNAIRALGKLDAVEAVQPLIKLLQRHDVQIQTEAACSLGTLKASQAIPSLLSTFRSVQCIDDQQTGRLNELKAALIKAIGVIGTKDQSVIDVIKGLAGHPTPQLRSASCCAMVLLTNDSGWITTISDLLNHREPLVRRSAMLDLGTSGHPDALEAIEAAAVESSLKLIALKALAEHTTNDAIFDAMDRLL